MELPLLCASSTGILVSAQCFISCRLSISYVIVTHIPIARQRLGKHIPEAYAFSNRRMSIDRYPTNKHAFLTTEDGVFRGVRAKEL
jgi:hypothetical protein